MEGPEISQLFNYQERTKLVHSTKLDEYAKSILNKGCVDTFSDIIEYFTHKPMFLLPENLPVLSKDKKI